MVTREGGIPRFEPHPWLFNGHLQTIGARFLVERKYEFPATEHVVDLSDGDRLTVLDSIPDGWRPGRPAALLVHGLAGSARSNHLRRLGIRLWRHGVRVVRMNLRGAGSGFGLARGIYHAGRTGDVRRVVEWMNARGVASSLALVGFSLGGNLVLKLAGEHASQPVEGLDCVLAANPPIDLAASCRKIESPENRIYDRKFTRCLRAEVVRLHERFPELGPVALPRTLSLREFDDAYTAPRNGYPSADAYYAHNSSASVIPRIPVSGLVVHAEDDPFIPVEPFRQVAFPATLQLELIPAGGHLGYVSHRRWNGDRRWLYARFAVWLLERWSLNANPSSRVSPSTSTDPSVRSGLSVAS